MSELIVSRRGKWLLVELGGPHEVLSWAVLNGGKKTARNVAWYQVTSAELAPPVDPVEFLRTRLGQELLSDAVGLLTSGNLDLYADVQKEKDGVFARAMVTAGMSNALRVGDPSEKIAAAVGTINLLCHISVPLSEEAMAEALSIATEARTLAVLEAGVPSIQSGEPATGTGTDCIVIAAPQTCPPENISHSAGSRFCGKHTVLGSLVGSSVLEATRMALKNWKESKS